MAKKVVLAYSGGLDTSYCVKYFTTDLGYEVHTVIVDTGGFDQAELDRVEKNAFALGATSHKAIFALNDFYNDCVKYMIYGNILKNNTYPLSVSSERIFQALKIAEYANEINADAIAHGSTGAGNDQVRFDLAFNIICPDKEIITPIRDLKLSRQAEIEYLEKHGVNWPWEKAQYSINKGIWGTSVGGAETLTSHKTLPESAYPTQLSETEPKSVKLTFTKGELTAIDGVENHPAENIQKLQEIAQKYAIGRDTHVGDTIIGIKGRVGFEAAAPLIIIKAHHLLEKHVLSKWQQHYKAQLADFYGMLLHEGQYMEPLMRDIEVFLASTQKRVTGEVEVALKPYNFDLIGITSKYDLMQSKAGQYGEMNNTWTADDAKGFIKIYGNAMKIYHSMED